MCQSNQEDIYECRNILELLVFLLLFSGSEVITKCLHHINKHNKVELSCKKGYTLHIYHVYEGKTKSSTDTECRNDDTINCIIRANDISEQLKVKCDTKLRCNHTFDIQSSSCGDDYQGRPFISVSYICLIGRYVSTIGVKGIVPFLTLYTGHSPLSNIIHRALTTT